MALFSIFLIHFLLSAESTNIVLDIGQTRDLPSSPLSTVRVQKKGIVSLKDRQTKITIIGKKLGTTRLSIGSKQYQITVMKKRAFEALMGLKKWEKGLRGPVISSDNSETVIKGKILRTDDFLSLGHWMNENSEFSIRATPLTNIKQPINEFLHSILRKENLEPSSVHFSPYWHILIHSKNNDVIGRYKKALNPFGVKVILDKKSLAQTPVLRFHLQIAHVKKSFFRSWGFRWPSEFSASTLPQFQLNNINVALNSLETQGVGRVLSSTSLVVESGKQGDFHSGGEFPVRTNTQFANNVHWKPYGLFLKIKPQTNALREIQLDIETELSAIDQSVATEGIPGMIRSQLKTSINLKKPQPIILSGLINSENGNNREGLAWLSQIPLLKPLFSTGEVYNNDYELVFILKPSFVQ